MRTAACPKTKFTHRLKEILMWTGAGILLVSALHLSYQLTGTRVGVSSEPVRIRTEKEVKIQIIRGVDKS